MEATVEQIKEKVQDTADMVTKNQNVGSTGRIISGLAGILLTLYGIKRQRSLMGKGLSLVGGMLLTRATTGFCPVNKALGRNTLHQAGIF